MTCVRLYYEFITYLSKYVNPKAPFKVSALKTIMSCSKSNDSYRYIVIMSDL